MPFIDLASFPNSRIRPRTATRDAKTDSIDLVANVLIQLVPSNADRTYVTLKNNSSTGNLKYCYGGDQANIDADGFLLSPNQAVDIETPEAIWVKPDANITVSVDEGQG